MTRSPSAPSALDAVLAHALRQASRHARSGALILIRPERATELQALPEALAAAVPTTLAEHLGRHLATLRGGSRATLVPCGDEIAVILPVLMRTEDAETMADGLLATLAHGPVEPHRQRIATLRSAGVHLGVLTAGHDGLPLDRLARLPFDELCLDRSWLAPLDAGRLRALDWLTGLARSLNLRVLADGVETEAQIDVLRRHHCDEIQGRLLSPPLDAESTGQLLAHARVQQRLVMEARTLALPMSTTRGSVSRLTRRLTATG